MQACSGEKLVLCAQDKVAKHARGSLGTEPWCAREHVRPVLLVVNVIHCRFQQTRDPENR